MCLGLIPRRLSLEDVSGEGRGAPRNRIHHGSLLLGKGPHEYQSRDDKSYSWVAVSVAAPLRAYGRPGHLLDTRTSMLAT